MSEVRQIQISADAYRPARGTRKRASKHKGGDSPPGLPVTGAANFAAARSIQAVLATGGSKPKAPLVITKSSPLAPPHPTSKPHEKVPEPAPAKSGKIVLNPPKKSPKKIILAPARTKVAGKVRETSKVRVHLSGLKKRLTRAKRITKESADKPIADIRKELEEAKLIKPLAGPGEKVPQGVLRGIHRDYLLLRNRAL